MDQSAPLVGSEGASLSSAVEAGIEGDVIPSMADDVAVNGKGGTSNDGKLTSVRPGSEVSLDDLSWKCTEDPDGEMIKLFGHGHRK